MKDSELLLFLETTKRWDQSAQDTLITEWNSRRQDIGRIGRNQVRTPCRLRSVTGSLKAYLLKKAKNGQPAFDV